MTKHSALHLHTVLSRVDGDAQFDLRELWSLFRLYQTPAGLAMEMLWKVCEGLIIFSVRELLSGTSAIACHVV